MHNGAQHTEANDAAFINGVDKAYKITSEFKNGMSLWGLCLCSWKSKDMEKAAEVFYNAASPYNPSYYWLDVEEKQCPI